MKRGRIIRRALEIALVALIVVLGASLVLRSHTPASRFAAFAPDDEKRITEAAWTGVAGGGGSLSEAATGEEVVAIVVAFHSLVVNPKSPPMAAAVPGDDAAKTAAELAKSLRASVPPQQVVSTVSIHAITDPRRIRIAEFAKRGWTFERGLDALMLCEDGECRAIPAVVQHARSMSFESARQSLHKGRGVEVLGLKLDDGLYRTRESAWLSNGPGQDVVPLFRASSTVPRVTSDDILRACRIGGDFLIKIQQPNGKWYYGYDAGKDDLDKVDYNLLRHAGTTYSMYQLYDVTREPRYLDAANAGLRWQRTVIEADPADPERLFVREPHNIKLGGAGLALMAYVEKRKVAGWDGEDERVAAGLARHCLLSQKDDGSFRDYHGIPGVNAKTRRSIYYPGEAMLGLIRYHQIVPERSDILDAVRRAADHLIDNRWTIMGMRFNVPPDAWLMLALEELHEADPNPKYADHCFRMARGMEFEQLGPRWGLDHAGGYYPAPPQVTPAGSRSEGLTAAWLLAKRLGDEHTADEIRETVLRSARFQVERVIRPDFVTLYPSPPRALGVFRHSPVSNAMRIDYNQHNISGLLIAARMTAEDNVPQP
ncbi:MAG: hypothetical protein IT350_06995 [Deltaproteobacteria bacterium]|nr:hypothetical protein [Deltaproteobacteria bacterium]